MAWKEVQEGLLVSLLVLEDQYQERFWHRRLDGIGLDTVNKEFLGIEFKRTQDTRSNYVERATTVAQAQYSSLLEGLEGVQVSHGLRVPSKVREAVTRIRCYGPTSHY